MLKTKIGSCSETLLGNISCGSLNVLNNWIYYVNMNDNGAIYRMDTDGQNNQKISDMQSVKNLMAIDNKLYFVSENEGSGGIYVMDTDGTGKTLLLSTEVSINNLVIYNGYIYYGIPVCNIFKTSVDGGNPETVVSAFIWGKINLCGNTLYYSTGPSTSQTLNMAVRGLHALNLDTNEDKILTAKQANDIYIINNQIYISLTCFQLSIRFFMKKA